MVDLVIVKADASHQVNLDFIGGCELTYDVVTMQLFSLYCGDSRRDVVTRVRVVRGEESVMEV